MEPLTLDELKRIVATITNVLNKGDYDPSDLEALTKAENLLNETIKERESKPLPF